MKIITAVAFAFGCCVATLVAQKTDCPKSCGQQCPGGFASKYGCGTYEKALCKCLDNGQPYSACVTCS